MVSSPSSIDAVLRFPKILLSREAFEATLMMRVDRFEPSRIGGAHYAQINLSENGSWDDLDELVSRVGRLIEPDIKCGQIGRPRVDVALYVEDGRPSASLLIPNAVALAIGCSGFDREISAYSSAAG